MEQNEQQMESATRYTVGETIYGICFFFGGKAPTLGFKYPYLYDDEEPTEIKIIPLTVRVHHKVADANDPAGTKDCDGFVLTDPQGNTWHNQYPYASYGQISDEGNRRFRRFVHTKEKAQALRDANEVIHCHLLSDCYDNIMRGLRHFQDPKTLDGASSLETRNVIQKRGETLLALKEKIDDQFLKDHQKKLYERQIWPGVEGVTTFYVSDPCSSTILSVKHLEMGIELEKFTTPELVTHIEQCGSEECMTNDAAVARLFHFGTKLVLLHMKEIYPELQDWVLNAVAEEVSKICLKPATSVDYSFLNEHIDNIKSNRDDDKFYLEMKEIQIFGETVNFVLWSLTKDIITHAVTPEVVFQKLKAPTNKTG